MAQTKKTDPKQDQNPSASKEDFNETSVRLDKIELSSKTQLRCTLNTEIIDEYAEAMKKRNKFPAVILFSSKDKYFVGDGYHRIEAAIKTGRKVIQAEIRPGGYAAALKYAASANDEHGLRRTQADKRKAIQVLLRDPDFCKKSDNQIAKIVNVSHNTVAAVRKEMEQSCQIDKMPIRQFERNGKTSEMDVASKKENLDKNSVAEEAEKKRFYLFDYDERPKSISNLDVLKNALHPDGFLLIVSNPGSLQKVFNKLNGQFTYLWTIAVAADQIIQDNWNWVDNKWRAISVWAKKFPRHLTFGDTLGLSPIDSPPDLARYIEELRDTFDQAEDTAPEADEIEYTEIEGSEIMIAKGGEI